MLPKLPEVTQRFAAAPQSPFKMAPHRQNYRTCWKSTYKWMSTWAPTLHELTAFLHASAVNPNRKPSGPLGARAGRLLQSGDALSIVMSSPGGIPSIL